MFPHPGQLDAKGGHTDEPTGRYHYHHPSNVISSGPRTPKFNRKDWFYWIDANKDCQFTRDEVLIMDSKVDVTFKGREKCKVVLGKWFGPYTGREFIYASEMIVDHIVSLSHAHKNGASNWSGRRKMDFANDPENLLSVDKAVIRLKGDKGPDEWRPPDKLFWCEYARMWKNVKLKYDLFISEPEKTSLQEMLKKCQ